MRIAYYAGASTAAAAVCLVKAFHERPNFYSATVYLSQSNACLLILTNLLLLCACTLVYALQRLLYGPLRPIEIEQLSERAWYAVLDTLLAMPSFREDVGGWLLTMFVLLLAGKVWGWIGEGRVDIFEQQPPLNPKLFHARLATSLLLSVIFDSIMVKYCFETVVADPRPGMMVIFTFEFAILLVFSSFTLGRYILNIVATVIQKQQLDKAIEARKLEIRAERLAAQEAGPVEGQEPGPSPDDPIDVDENEVDVPGWEDKRRYLFGLEMTSDFLKLLLYIIFFTVSITFNGLPMHIMRDVYMTFTAFTKRLGDYVNYKKATSDMNARYPDATTEEIRGDACIVCREDMVAWQDAPDAAGQAARRDEGTRAKKLPCGHILHLRCLKAWLERQQVCPTCRRPVVSNSAPPAAPPVNGAANPPPPNAAPAPPQRPGNRARFFNLGPIRLGFLNGPAAEVDNMVNQMAGLQPQARQIVPPALPPAAAAHSQQQSATAMRLSQEEIMQLSNRMMHESVALNVEASQLLVIRAMAQELERLQAEHRRNVAATHGVNPADITAPQSDHSIHRGFPAQQLDAGHPDLPEGIVLPQGWSLMPLHRAPQPGSQVMQPQMHLLQTMLQHMPQPPPQPPSSSNVSHPQPQPPSSSNVLHPQPIQPAQSTAPLRTISPSVQQPSVSETTQAASSSSGRSSPLFTITPAVAPPAPAPAAVPPAAPSSSNDQGQQKTAPAQSQSQGDWSFDNADSSQTEPKQDKGKGKAVAVEDVPDSES